MLCCVHRFGAFRAVGMEDRLQNYVERVQRVTFDGFDTCRPVWLFGGHQIGVTSRQAFAVSAMRRLDPSLKTGWPLPFCLRPRARLR